MSARIIEANKLAAKKLEEEGERLENYNIVNGFAFYRGAPVDYVQIKMKFELRVRKFIEKEENKLEKGKDVFDETESKIALSRTKRTDEEEETSGEVNLTEGKVTDLEKISLLDFNSTATTITSSSPTIQILKDTKSVGGFISSQENPATRIGIFLNLNGTSKTRKNVLVVNKKVFKMDELAAALLLEDKTKGEKEKTDRSNITVERIQACYAEETAIFLSTNPSLSKFQKIGNLGFTKSFYCFEVATTRIQAKRVYTELLLLTKTWTGRGNPKRFADKMKKYYQTVLNQFTDLFDEVEAEFLARGITF